MNKKISILDSIMGSGKSTWAFNYMYEQIDEKFIYITPYLSEIERLLYEKDEDGNLLKDENEKVIKSKWYKDRLFRQPIQLGEGKVESLQELVRNGYSIAATHSLFKMMTQETIDLIKSGGYTLILDEAIAVMEVTENLSISDYEMMVTSEKIEVGLEGRIKWVDEIYDGGFNEFRTMCENGIMVEVKKTKKHQILCWNLKIESFKCFNEVYVLTYLFEASLLSYYFKMYDMDFEKYCIEDNSLVKYEDRKLYDKSSYRELIQLYDGNLNNIGDRPTNLSFNWFKKNKIKRVSLKNNMYNYFQHKVKAKGKDIIWTTFQKYRPDIAGKGYTNSFVPCNMKATNAYKESTVLAYCCNRYRSPDFINYFFKFDIKIDQDIFALSEIVQWCWRSSIREHNPIVLYVPSKRMRNLIKEWLNNEYI